MLIDIANGQAATGDDVTVLIVNDKIEPKLLARFSPDVKVLCWRRTEGKNALLLMARLNWLVLTMRPDIVHGHHQKFGRLIQLRRKHLLITIHELNNSLEYCATANMAAITDAVRDDILARVPSAKVRTVLNGIRCAAVRHRGQRFPGETFVIVQVGSLKPEIKGQDVLLQALAELKRRGRANFHLTFIGDGPGREELERYVSEKGLQEQVTFAGIRGREEIYGRLAEFDAMVHPSRYEGFGLIVAEAMAAGLPLVLTEHDGTWEVADNGRLCLSAPAGDAVAVADRIAELADNYPAALARASEALDYVKKYDISRTVEAYRAYYLDLI